MNLLAQLAAENPALYIFGPMGIFLAWFMWLVPKALRVLNDLAHRIDGLTKALLVDMVERESTGANTKRYAQETIAKIDARAGTKG